MDKSVTLTVKIIDQEGLMDLLSKGQLTDAQKGLIKLVAKEVVNEYIREIQCKDVRQEVARLTIPETGFVRLPQILKVIPLGKTCWWAGVKSGRFPKSIKLSERCVAWKAEDIHDLIKRLS